MALDRFESRAADGLRLLADGEEFWHRRPVNVGIEDADLEAEVAQAERQIDRDGRFADAAFAGGDRDDRVDAGNAGLRLRRAPRLRADAQRRAAFVAAVVERRRRHRRRALP